MKKALLIAAGLALLSIPALAQQSPTGQSAGGPARVGNPGEVGGGVPGTMPNKPMKKKMKKAKKKKSM
jgi:hypothetical protein